MRLPDRERREYFTEKIDRKYTEPIDGDYRREASVRKVWLVANIVGEILFYLGLLAIAIVIALVIKAVTS